MPYILIVDDDEDFASAVAAVLRGASCETRIISSPSDMIGAIRERRPDLVILDVMFPEDNTAGFDLARAIREFGDDAANIPILMLTAINERFPLGFGAGDIDERWLPVTSFMEKPVDLESLKKEVLHLTGGKNAD